MLDLAILGLLQDGPVHGYELKKRLDDSFGHLSGVSFGSLYPALARLERIGAIEAIDPGPSGGSAAGEATAFVPATGSIAGEAAAARLLGHLAGRAALRRSTHPSRRTRKAYRLAPRGVALFSELLAADAPPGADPDRAFALRLTFARHLDTERRLELLRRRRRELAARLARGRAALAGTAGSRPAAALDRYARALLERETSTAEADLGWVDSLIAAETSVPTYAPVPLTVPGDAPVPLTVPGDAPVPPAPPPSPRRTT